MEGSLQQTNYLVAYQVHCDSGGITLLDKLELGLTEGIHQSILPRLEHHSQRVFIPGDSGVTVDHLDWGRLVKERTLTCVRYAVSVDIMSPDTVYVSNGSDVSAVDVTNDSVMWTLEQPSTMIHHPPYCLAVLGDNVMVGLFHGTPVMYLHDCPIPDRARPQIWGLGCPYTISTERKHHFLITDSTSNAVYVVDASGTLLHRVDIDTTSSTVDCAVVNKQLWVGCKSGDIVIMSTE